MCKSIQCYIQEQEKHSEEAGEAYGLQAGILRALERVLRHASRVVEYIP